MCSSVTLTHSKSWSSVIEKQIVPTEVLMNKPSPKCPSRRRVVTEYTINSEDQTRTFT